MDTDRMIRGLRFEAEKHKDDNIFTFQTSITDMCLDTARRLEELMHFKDTISKYYGNGLQVVNYPVTDDACVKSFDDIFKEALESELEGEVYKAGEVSKIAAKRVAMQLAKQNNDPLYQRVANPDAYMSMVDPITGKVYSVPKDTALYMYDERGCRDYANNLMRKFHDANKNEGE